MRRLAYTVIVDGEVFPAGTPEDAQLRERITNPAAWAGVENRPVEVDPPDPRSVEPPRAGAGASTAAWRDHAETLGVVVPADATRDDIIAAVDAR